MKLQKSKIWLTIVLVVVAMTIPCFTSFAAELEVVYKELYTDTQTGATIAYNKWQNTDLFDSGIVLEDDGKYSVKMDMRQTSVYDGNYREIRFTNNDAGNRLDITEIFDTGVLRFKMKIEADDETRTAEKVEFYFLMHDDSTSAWAGTKHVELANAADIKADGTWHDVEIPLSQFIRTDKEVDYAKLASFTMKPPNNDESRFDFYFRDIVVYNTIRSPEISYVSSGMNDSGYFNVQAEVTSRLESSTVSKEDFSINGVTARSLDIDGTSLMLEFDVDVFFPDEITLDIAEGIMSVNDLELETRELVFETGGVQNKISIVNVTQEPIIEDNTVTASAAIRIIYAPDTIQKATMLMVVYDGDKIIAVQPVTTQKDLIRRKTEKLTAIIELPEGETLEDPRAELFFFENMESKTPIAEMLAFDI